MKSLDLLYDLRIWHCRGDSYFNRGDLVYEDTPMNGKVSNFGHRIVGVAAESRKGDTIKVYTVPIDSVDISFSDTSNYINFMGFLYIALTIVVMVVIIHILETYF